VTGRLVLLIVNADDYNLSPGVSAGILEAHRRGILTSTTALVNLPGLEGASRAAATCPALGVGLHLNLTLGPPCAPAAEVPGLLGADGCFRREPKRVPAEASPHEVAREWEGQLARFRAVFGRGPTHLDSHHDVHAHPRLFPVALRLARAAGLPLRAQTAPLREEARRQGVATPDAFAGDVAAGPYWTVPRLLETLSSLTGGSTELMCHPGRWDLPEGASRYHRQREGEIEALCAPAVRREVERRGIRLVTFAALAAGAPR